MDEEVNDQIDYEILDELEDEEIPLPSDEVRGYSTLEKIAKSCFLHDDGTIHGETVSNRSTIPFIIKQSSPNLNISLSRAIGKKSNVFTKLRATPPTSLDDLHAPVKPCRKRPKYTPPEDPIQNTDDIEVSDGELSEGIKDVLDKLHVPRPTLHLKGRYDMARSYYKQRGYELIKSVGPMSFFTSKPVRILIAVFPPQLVCSIIDHTNKYIEVYRKNR